MNPARIIGNNILRRLGQLDMTQRELARRSKTDDAAISRYVTAQRCPRVDVLVRIARALECSTDDLLEGVE